MRLLKKIFCLIGNYLPPKLNCFFYKFSGVNFNLSKVWIGNKCYLDNNFPENITIGDNVCISSEVTIICHFDPVSQLPEWKLVCKYSPGGPIKNRRLLLHGIVWERLVYCKSISRALCKLCN